MYGSYFSVSLHVSLFFEELTFLRLHCCSSRDWVSPPTPTTHTPIPTPRVSCCLFTCLVTWLENLTELLSPAVWSLCCLSSKGHLWALHCQPSMSVMSMVLAGLFWFFPSLISLLYLLPFWFHAQLLGFTTWWLIVLLLSTMPRGKNCSSLIQLCLRPLQEPFWGPVLEVCSDGGWAIPRSLWQTSWATV